MAVEYSVDVIKGLEDNFRAQQLHRPMRIDRYEAGQKLSYDVMSVVGNDVAKVDLIVEKFVGGGFAGQVYRVEVLSITKGDQSTDSIGDVVVGSKYAMKILIPPSKGSLAFRNLVYAVGFQGPFQLQVSPAAARAGAIWQKFIRRAAQKRFSDEKCVNDIHVTFVDETLGSCGELTDWVDGRTWRLEVDENLDTLRRWLKGKDVDESKLGSDEYRAKKKWMADFVDLLHEMGAHEFARQYEWWTCKSQPNCLKRTDTGDDPQTGLIAVDFRAGLALLPFLPMSPGDIKLICDGLKRGSLVQFDRGNLNKLEAFVVAGGDDYADMTGLLDELRACEDIYRNSLPDITHNGLRLLYSPKLWNGIYAGAINGWKVRNIIDERVSDKLKTCKVLTTVFFIVGLIGALGKVATLTGVLLGLVHWIGPYEKENLTWLNNITPSWWLLLIGGVIASNASRLLRKVWGRADWRKHYSSILTDTAYFKRAIAGRINESIIAWYRKGRINSERAIRLSISLPKFLANLPLSILPAFLHRAMTDWKYLTHVLWFIFIRLFKLLFKPDMRAQWMRDMVIQGRKKHILSDEDADTVLGQLDDPYIQRYLVSLVVHAMTAPVTQIVSITHAWIWNLNHPDVSDAKRAAVSTAIIVAYQITPLSPGSFCRGLYTTILAIYDRNFKDYNIAIFLSYFKYIGYLAFPIQMAYRYPAMARFMAGHWATGAVHIVPVFGEQGALLERWVFCLFYNWPLTLRRRISKRLELRQPINARYFHVPIVAAIFGGMFAYAHYLHAGAGIEANRENYWYLKDLWYLMALLPLLNGAAVTVFAMGADLWKRIVAGMVGGIMMGILYTIGAAWGETLLNGQSFGIAAPLVWRIFAFTIFSVIGVIITELVWPDSDIKR